jgi:membrane protease YdiL (CAAX protease family)
MPPSLPRSWTSPPTTPPTADPLAVVGAPLLAGTPYRLLGVLAGGLACCAALVSAGVLAREALGIAAVTAAHGGMLATATGWAASGARGRVHDDPAPPAASPWCAAVLAALAAVFATVHTAGAVAYLFVPIWVAWHARHGHFMALGLGTPIPRGVLALGVIGGAFLGSHLLVSASLTLGYRPGAVDPHAIAVALTYDAGLQVVATESFFRGALFNRLQRRWSFAGAAAVTSAASVVRYLVDPLLPGATELVIGAAFYITLLSLLSAWLFWRSGSLVPGYLASVVFFVAYRQLGVR